MAQQSIKFTIRQDGTVTEEVMGVVGTDCENLTKRIEERLGVVERVEHKPEVGDVLIFSDDTLHRVLPHKDSDLRISLAFNYQKSESWKGFN